MKWPSQCPGLNQQPLEIKKQVTARKPSDLNYLKHAKEGMGHKFCRYLQEACKQIQKPFRGCDNKIRGLQLIFETGYG